MEQIYSYKEGEKTSFYTKDYLDDDYSQLYLIERNGAFLYMESEYNDDTVLDLFSDKSDSKDFLSKYCEKNDWSQKITKLFNPPSFILELEEIKSNYEGLIDEEFDKLVSNEEEISNNINNILDIFKSDYIQPIYNEYINRTRTSQKRIDSLEELLEIKTNNFIGYTFFRSLEGVLDEFSFFS